MPPQPDPPTAGGSSVQPLAGVKYKIAVASGKGGVGKSTTAINLALSLREVDGVPKKVGVLDADIYGPSMAVMFGLEGAKPTVNERKQLMPVEAYGVKVVSLAFLSDPNKPVIWRGPMVHNILQQFLRDVAWGELDYLIIDMPPGTGDAQLSISQLVNLSGAVIVTTPQKVSLIDARKGLQTFRQLKVPVLGVVENMSFLELEGGERMDIFGTGGGQRIAQELEIPFLGEIPLDPRVVTGGDTGRPIVASHADLPVSAAYRGLATQVVEKLLEAERETRPSNAPLMPGPIQWKKD